MHFVIQLILLLLSIYFRNSAISFITGGAFCLYLIYLLMSKFEKINFHNKLETERNTSTSIPSKNLSSYQVERFAVMCNAQLEHDDEMEQYKDMIEEAELVETEKE